MVTKYKEILEHIIKEIIKRIDVEFNKYYDEKGIFAESRLRKIKKSYTIQEVGHKIIFINYNFIYYFYWWNYGRKPSIKYPPFAPINAWVKNKIKPIQKDEISTTFAVMSKIKKHGYEGRFMIPNIREKVDDIINTVVNEYIRTIPGDDRLRFVLYLCGDILIQNIYEMIQNNTYTYTIQIKF